MVLAITLNLVAIIVIVGGWTLAVRALYKGLADPHAKPEAGRQHGAAPAPGTSPLPGTVLQVKRAA